MIIKTGGANRWRVKLKNKLMDLLEYVDLLNEVMDEDREEDQVDRPLTRNRKDPFQIHDDIYSYVPTVAVRPSGNILFRRRSMFVRNFDLLKSKMESRLFTELLC
uniref:Uncharacterized protein n=1 Tax=Romanomermis culicivorax TaxID=13658 RepID=A0A915KNR6_ROMCU